MDANLLSCNNEDEDFIDMEVVSSSSHSNSPSKSIEFEFQMTSDHSTTHSNSPADELFYKGKLLPLHFPPRAQMVNSLLQVQTTKFKEDEEFITFATPMAQSCNISPTESCRVSTDTTELTPDEYFFEWSTELTGFINDHPKKYYGPWSKKLRLIKESSISQKLKASRSFLKSLFNKSACGSDGNPCSKQEHEQDCDNSFLKKCLRVSKKSGLTFEHIQARKYPTLANVLKGIQEQGDEDVFDGSCMHRKSFSGAIKRKCSPYSSTSSSTSTSTSSSFSYSNNGIYELQMFKRNSSANSELEGSIEAAIDHCKKSQQVFDSRNNVVFPKCTL